MNMRRHIITLVALLTVLIPCSSLMAAAMAGGVYQIQSDSINFGGGNSGTGTYILEDTLGEVASGDSSSTNYTMRAGYQQMQESFISLSVTGNPSLGNIGGISAGSALSSTTWTVITDSASGYSMTAQAATSPALKGTLGAYFDDLVPTGGPTTPDYVFNVASNQSAFAFSPEGVDIISKYKDNGTSACNTGSTDSSDRCWDGFSTTPKIIAQGSGPTTLLGTGTVLKYQVKIGSNKIQDAQSYAATITVTAVTL
jgi:hypothetical protein